MNVIIIIIIMIIKCMIVANQQLESNKRARQYLRLLREQLKQTNK